MQPAPPVPPAPEGSRTPPEQGGDHPSGRTGATRSGLAARRAEYRDRWEWRARIRADPGKHRIYRVVVACVGVFLILLGAATGWLPGPGGIPLVLAGLAVLASEFVWAHRLLKRARLAVHRFTRWAGRQPLWLRLTGSGVGVAVALGGAWLFLVVLGPPEVLPAGAIALLDRIPGVDS
ncbi:PGPGW domain-containing protein [Quadrisphaera granulorum]|uniref:PGPGW domain-containing protein n=1 Tax=Quadrisphaera granulorum TaxID=317664 RepID=UPI0014765507|nr:PGPGW domain-containing protein [Quadrisphaera granulorum]